LKYNLYLKEHVRKVPIATKVSYDEAVQFFDRKFAYVEDTNGKSFTTKEELENVKSVKFESRERLYSATASGGEVSETASGELYRSSDGSGGETDSTQ